jgi:S-adenosylmethionine decarboxylase
MGDHYLLNLFDCDPDILNDEEFIKRLLDDAAYCAKMTVLNITSYKFYPQGVTAIALLSESHMSIHTWPETGKAAVDVYTCGEDASPKLACDVIKVQLKAREATIQHIKR